MKGSGNEEPDLGRILRGLLRRRAGTLLLGIPVGMAIAGALMCLYGSGRSGGARHHDVADGIGLVWVAARSAAAGVAGNWVARRKRRIRVEDELDAVKDSLYRVEDILTGGPRGVVRPLRRH